MKLEKVKEILFKCYSKDLCYKKVKKNWNDNNKSYGMCAITSLLINDLFGGEICKIHVDGISHYYNLINSTVIDVTASQFNHEIDYTNYEIVPRNSILTEDTLKRYNLLKERFNKLSN